MYVCMYVHVCAHMGAQVCINVYVQTMSLNRHCTSSAVSNTLLPPMSFQTKGFRCSCLKELRHFLHSR